MRPLIVIRRTPKIDFMAWHKIGFAFSLLLTLGSIGLFLIVGLNYGIDFVGGTLIEVRSTTGPANLAEMRQKLDALHLGEPSLQGFGPPTDVLIRLPRQPGGDAAQEQAVAKVRQALGSGVEYRRTEVVGPSVGSELIRAGVIATVLALFAIAAYIWFRFEWQFGVGGMVSTLHDVLTTVGLFALLQLEFNLTTLAAILTIAGYSVNDTVVIYDRIRETLRKYPRMPFRDLINLALNETLSRTILTVSTVALAVLALLFLGGPVLRGFQHRHAVGCRYRHLLVALYCGADPLLCSAEPRRHRPVERGSASPRSRGALSCSGRRMDLTPVAPVGRQIIERYAASGFRVSGVIYHGPILVFPDLTVAWEAASASDVTWETLTPVLERGGVEILLLGLGRSTGAVPAALRTALRAARIAVEAMDTGAACRTYNVLVAEDRRVAAALIPPASNPLKL